MSCTKNIAKNCRGSARGKRDCWPSATCSVRYTELTATSQWLKKIYFRRTSRSRSTGAACHGKISGEAPVFHEISPEMRQVMHELEEQTERDQRSLRSVNTDVGRLLLILAMSAPQGAFLELGSSGGYSTLWLSLAARAKGGTVTTVDLDEKKVALAQEDISRAGASRWIEVVHGNAFDYATRFENIAFCFSDIEPPEANAQIYELIVPRLVSGGWLVIDNVTSPRLQTDLLKRAEKDSRVDCVLLPFPKGDLICRKC